MTEFNKDQQAAIHANSPLTVVIAAAGSGKTSVLTERIAHRINHRMVLPESVMAVTFTNKAAGEMKERLVRKNKEAAAVTAGTFHSICLDMLKEDGHLIGIQDHFTILSPEEQKELMGICLSDVSKRQSSSFQHFHYNNNPDEIRRYGSLISQFKNSHPAVQAEPGRFFAESDTPSALPLYRLYEEKKEAMRLLDFDDLLLKAVELLQKNPEVQKKYRSRFVDILVDEYQDTNDLQVAWLKLIRGHNLFLVGDDDQSITAGAGRGWNIFAARRAILSKHQKS